jgi:hypothetical protein
MAQGEMKLISKVLHVRHFQYMGVWDQQGFCYLLVEGHQSYFKQKKIGNLYPMNIFVINLELES